MAKILVIEDEPKILQIIRAYLEKEGFEVFTAKDGAEGMAVFAESGPDLIVLDRMLPTVNGDELLMRIRQTADLPIIILSAKSAEDDRIFGLNIGADDYLVKPFSPRELVARINAQLRRNKALSAQAGAAFTKLQSFNEGRLVIDTEKYETRLDGRLINLTNTEFKILVLLSEFPGKVFSRSQLVEQVQGYNYDGYDRTIDSHIKNLRQKIEPVPEEPNFIITIFGVGYKFGGKRDE